MSDEHESRLVLTNGRAPLNKRGDWLTRGQAEKMVHDAAMAERAENEQMVKWYMVQIPELVAKMLGDALAANGLVMKGPESAEPVAASTTDVAGDADVPTIAESPVTPDSPDPAA